MLFLVELDHVKSGGLSTAEQASTFIQQIILPTLSRMEELVAENKIIAGGLTAGSIAPRFIVAVEAATDIDKLLFSIPLWPVAVTKVTPLVSFDERRSRVNEVLDSLRSLPRKLQSEE